MFSELIAYLHNLPVPALWLGQIAVVFASILLLLRLFGASGLYVFIVLAIIGANLQVLKTVETGLFSDPVALGTVLFSASYLCTDILAEYYGPQAARRGVLIGFLSLILWLMILTFTMGFAPAQTPWAQQVQDSMELLFTPIPALLLAGMLAYLISQYHDVWIFGLVRKFTAGRYLWLRNTVSTALSALIDNIIFSVLAWVVFAETPLETRTLIMTYILGTYVLRLAVAVLDTPFVYLAGRLRPVADR